MSGYVVIRHPITKRFVCKVDFERQLMYVKDRGREAVIDLAEMREQSVSGNGTGDGLK